jgi:hypothetical protein
MDGHVAPTQQTELPAPKPGRVAFVSVARGYALLFIVFGAGVRMAADVFGANPGRFPASTWMDALGVHTVIDSATWVTRVPVLFFLSGLFLDRSIAKGSAAFVRARGKSVVWPLILWTIVSAVFFSFWHWPQVVDDRSRAVLAPAVWVSVGAPIGHVPIRGVTSFAGEAAASAFIR